MKRATRGTGLALIAVVAGSPVWSQSTERLSVDSSGAQTNDASQDPSVSANGRFVAFWSNASNLVPGDTNGVADVFVHDRQSGTTECVSVDPAGMPGNATSGSHPSISADGRFVVFSSVASNLVAGDTNAFSDIFVRDRQSGTTARVSMSVFGTQANSWSYDPVLSADGRFVVFDSNASNLVLGDTNAVLDVFVRDLQSGTTELVSVSTSGAQGTQMSNGSSAISADGRFVAFWSFAPNLVAGDTNNYGDIFRRDRQTGTTERVSLSTGGTQGNNHSYSPSISADGRFVGFMSFASNLDPTDTNGVADVFLRDMQSVATERVSLSTGGAQGDADSSTASLSADGRYVAFWSQASNLISNDTNGVGDIFVRDRQSGTTECVSVDSAGMPGNDASGFSSYYSSISADGRIVVFSSYATNLVPGDTNLRQDVFARDRGAPPATAFCFGDGTGTACPCGTGAAGNGCPSSVNANGANLGASGNASLGNDTLALLGSGMPDSTCLYFQGTTQINAVFGDGLRCAGGTIVRLGRRTNIAGVSQYPVGTEPSVSVKGNVTASGVRTYQAWYRNAAAFCTSATFNLTNGLLVTWVQ